MKLPILFAVSSIFLASTVCKADNFYNISLSYDKPLGDPIEEPAELIVHGVNARGTYMYEVLDNAYIGIAADVTVFGSSYDNGNGSSSLSIGNVSRTVIGPAISYSIELSKSISVAPTISPGLTINSVEGGGAIGYGFSSDFSLPIRFQTSRRFSLGLLTYYKFIGESSWIYYDNESSAGVGLEFNFKF